MAKAVEGNLEDGSGRLGGRRRTAAWVAAALAPLVPLVLMQITDRIAWDVFDFAVMGTLLAGAGVTYALAVRMTGHHAAYRAAVGLWVAAIFILVWVIGAVGIVAAAGDPADLMYGGVIAVGIIGTAAARFQPRGMARVSLAMALAQALVGAIALIAGLVPAYNSAYEILGINGLFVALFVGSAGLFRRAAREQPPAAAGPED